MKSQKNPTNPMTRICALLAVVAAGLAATACGGAAPPVGPVDLSSGAGSSSVAPPGPAPVRAPGAPVDIDGEHEVAAGEAGTVRFAVAGQQVSLLDVALAPGWQQTGERRGSDEVTVSFAREQTVVSVEADVDDGRFEADVDIDAPLVPARVTYPVADAGTVTVDVSPGFVTLVSQEAAPGWVATVDERELSDGDVEIQFRNDGASRSVEFDADADDGRLSVDIDSRTGANHFVRGPGR